jgi:hypothetical protein
LRYLSVLLQRVQSDNQDDITPEAWEQLLVVLLIRLRVIYQHAGLEETLPRHILELLLRLLQKALPQVEDDMWMSESTLELAKADVRQDVARILELIRIESDRTAQYAEGLAERVSWIFRSDNFPPWE